MVIIIIVICIIPSISDFFFVINIRQLFSGATAVPWSCRRLVNWMPPPAADRRNQKMESPTIDCHYHNHNIPY